MSLPFKSALKWKYLKTIVFDKNSWLINKLIDNLYFIIIIEDR